jgi:hypothetical protein
MLLCLDVRNLVLYLHPPRKRKKEIPYSEGF